MSDAASDQPSVRGDPNQSPAALSVTSVIAAAGGAPPDAPHAPVGPTNPTARMLSEMPLYDVPQQQAAPPLTPPPAPPSEPIDVTPAPVGIDPAPQPANRSEHVAWFQNHVADLEGEVRRAVQELEKLHGGAENPHPHTFVAIRNALSHLVDLARKLKP